MIPIFLLILSFTAFSLIWNFSLVFRHAYLKQKLFNRTTPEEQKQINETDLDFWSFLK